MADFNQAMCDEEAIVCRYADLEWTDDVRGFECARCGRVLIQHYIANCQHKFCSNCHKLMGDGSQRWKCPLCHDFILTIERQDFEFRDQVYQLGVHCPNQKYGCHHTCSLIYLKGHMDGCEHTRERALPVPLEGHRSPQMLGELLELRTEVMEMRQMMTQMEKRWNDRELERETDLVNINSRVDEISCKLSTENLELNNKIALVGENNKSNILKMDGKVDLMMNMLEMKEKNLHAEMQNFKILMKKQDEDLKKMEHAMKVLEKDLRQSKAEMGENVEKLKADTESFTKEEIKKVKNEIQHIDRLHEWNLEQQVVKVNEKMEDDVSRLNVKLRKVEENVETLKTEISKKFLQNKTIDKLTTQLSRFNLIEHNSNFTPDFQWRICGIMEKFEQNKIYKIKSEVFKWTKYPVRAEAKLEIRSNGDVHMYLCLEKHIEGEVKSFPRVYYLVRDQTKTNNPKHICRTRSYAFPSKFNYSFNFHALISHKSHLTDSRYNVDDSIVFDIYVEPPKMAQSVHSYNGNLDWTIDNYNKRKEMEQEELVWSHESPYFYTGPKGYRVRVRICFGLRFAFGLKAYIDFLPGEFDSNLPTIFPHRTTITFINRKNPQRNVTKTLEEDINYNKSYTIVGCSEKEIDNLIENDSLYCNVTIEAI